MIKSAGLKGLEGKESGLDSNYTEEIINQSIKEALERVLENIRHREGV